MSPAEQAAWLEQLFFRWHSGISAPLFNRCCISCLRGWEGKEESKPCTEGGFVPGLPQVRTQREVDVLGEEKGKSQAGSGESWEAVGFLPDTTEVTASHWHPTPSTLVPAAYPWASSGGEHRAEQCKGLHRITGKLPESQESLEREKKPWRDVWKATAPPSAPFSVHTSLHYLTLHSYPPSKFASVSALLRRLAGSQRPQKGSLTADLHGEGDVENWGGRGTRLIDTFSFQHNFTGWLLAH